MSCSVRVSVSRIYSYVYLYSPLYCCRINLLKQMSHNNGIMICTFGFVIWFVPSEFWYQCFLFFISSEEESNGSTPSSFDFGLQTSFSSTRNPWNILHWTVCPSVSWNPLVRSLFSGADPENQKEGAGFLTRKTVRRVGVVQKRFENARKKGGRGHLGPSPKFTYAFKWAYFCGQLMVRFKAFLTPWACAWIRLHHKRNIYLLTWRLSFFHYCNSHNVPVTLKRI